MREWEWHKGHTELGSQCLKLHKEVCVSDLAIQCDLATNHHQQKAEEASRLAIKLSSRFWERLHSLERTFCRRTAYHFWAQISHSPQASTLANKRFVRTSPPQVTHQVSKRALRARLPPKFTRQSFENEHFVIFHPPQVKREASSERTHQAAVPSSFAIPAPQSRTPPNVKT